MKIVVGAYPPNIDLIDCVFHVRGLKMLFAFGDAIYNPAGVEVTPMLVEHEKVHSYRQKSDPWAWWDRYCRDADFRLQEEVYAHGVELKWLWERCSGRNSRRQALARTAGR